MTEHAIYYGYSNELLAKAERLWLARVSHIKLEPSLARRSRIAGFLG